MVDEEAIDTAVSLIERIVKKAEVGEIYDGTIARVNDNYAFVTLFEGTDKITSLIGLMKEQAKCKMYVR